jgi:hypothetical protein
LTGVLNMPMYFPAPGMTSYQNKIKGAVKPVLGETVADIASGGGGSDAVMGMFPMGAAYSPAKKAITSIADIELLPVGQRRPFLEKMFAEMMDGYAYFKRFYEGEAVGKLPAAERKFGVSAEKITADQAKVFANQYLEKAKSADAALNRLKGMLGAGGMAVSGEQGAEAPAGPEAEITALAKQHGIELTPEQLQSVMEWKKGLNANANPGTVQRPE